MPDQVWRVLYNNGTTPMYFWRKADADRAAAEIRAKAPVLVDRPDGQPVN